MQWAVVDRDGKIVDVQAGEITLNDEQKGRGERVEQVIDGLKKGDPAGKWQDRKGRIEGKPAKGSFQPPV